MSNKFTGITSGGQEIPVYDKAALHDAYSAGNNISINGNVISVTGRKSLAVQSPLSAEVSGNSIIISLDESAIDVSSKLDTSAFAEVSGSFLTSGDLDEYVTSSELDAAISGKADTTAIPSLDGYATQEWVGEQGYLTEVPAGYATTEDVISATSGLQPSGDYYSASNPSGFITSGELPDPVTIAVQEGETLDTDYDGLKIVKSTSNGNEHINLHKKSTDQWLIHGGLVPTSPGSNKYLITDNSGAMHWDNTSALAYDSAFEQSGGYITAYNGSAFKAGDELPASVSAATDYVTATSGNINDTINNVSANSGTWGGSALPISAGPGIGLSMVDGVLVISVTGGN